MKVHQRIKGKHNLQSYQKLGNVVKSQMNNCNNISINELPCEILLLLLKIIQQLLNERKAD